MQDLLPQISLQPGTPIATQVGRDKRPIWLEIGFGGGEHLAAQARAHPDVNLIGCEPFLNGVAKLLSQIDADGSQNVRIYADDARDIFPDFAERTVDRVFVLFPDPWPKTKHHKRRLIQTDLLDHFARILADGGQLCIASDHMGYIRWSLEKVLAHGAFEWVAEGPADWRHPPADWIQTRYEQKALAKGDKCVYLRFRRKRHGPRGNSGATTGQQSLARTEAGV